MKHYVGLDVSVKETSVCVIDGAGRTIREVKVPTEPEAILAALADDAFASERIGLEAGRHNGNHDQSRAGANGILGPRHDRVFRSRILLNRIHHSQRTWIPSRCDRMTIGHQERNQVRVSYNRAKYMEERRQMMQKWADMIEEIMESKIGPSARAA